MVDMSDDELARWEVAGELPDLPDAEPVDLEVQGEFIVYQSDDGRTRVQLKQVDGTVWMTQVQIARLFETSRTNVVEHAGNIYREGELQESATCRDFRQVRSEGSRTVTRSVRFYNLDMILAVGYRVRSPRGAQFRRWASTVLHEYLAKGFAMDDERLKDPKGRDYFDELLERIRDIRASEKRFYQKVRDVFTTAVDYDPKSALAREFFAQVQNKMTFSVTGSTAAELIVERADSAKPNMGLTSWKGDRVRKQDVTIAKNYLNEEEARELNQMVSGLLDTAEARAQRRLTTTMQDWATFVDSFVALTGGAVLQGRGKTSHRFMETLAHRHYEDFDSARRARELATAEEDHFAEIEHLRQTGEGLDRP